MTATQYKLSSAVALLLVAAFPVFQIFQSRGLIFYTNGWDEASYLQYDYSKHVLEISSLGRIAQWPVMLLHEAGLSGGWINFLSDTLFTLFLILILPPIFKNMGFSQRKSNIFCVSLLGLPLLLSNLNPLMLVLSDLNSRSTSLRWLTTPVINDPFWLRTPEPQASFFLILSFLYLSQKTKNIYFLFVPLIFAYPFIKLPMAFVLLAILISAKGRLKLTMSVIVSALIISFALLAYGIFVVDDFVGGYIINSHLPLLSFCGLLSIPILLRAVKSPHRQPIFLLISSIWFATNFQLISGFTIQPNNFEQYWSVAALILAFLFYFQDSPYLKAAPILSLLILCIWSANNFYVNLKMAQKIDLNDELLQAIKVDSSKVAVNDIYLSTRLDMLYPKQSLTLFSYSRFYKKLPEERLGEYLCARDALSLDPAFEDTLNLADEYYRNGDQNTPLNTIYRVIHPWPQRAFDFPEPCEIKMFHVIE